MPSIFHILSTPEHIWLEFLRTFFSQPGLYRTIEDGNIRYLQNEFIFDADELPETRKFDIVLGHDDSTVNHDALPLITIQDTGMSLLGITTKSLRSWSINARNTSEEKADLAQSTYIIHCLAQDRGSSRLLAATVVGAISTFYDVLLESGLHKLSPPAVGMTTSVKDPDHNIYIDTPVTVMFQHESHWSVSQNGHIGVKKFFMDLVPDSVSAFARTLCRVVDRNASVFANTIMLVSNKILSNFANTLLDVVAPISDYMYANTRMWANNPVRDELYARTTMRVAKE